MFDFLYLCGAVVASPFLLWKMLADGRFRHKLAERFGQTTPAKEGFPRVWIHAASVGETRAALPLVERLRKRHPEISLMFTTLTRSGQETAQQLFPDASVRYWPLDFSFAVRAALKTIRPDVVVLLELEVWPNFIREARRMKIPVLCINARVSDRSFRGYRWGRWLLSRPFRRITSYGVQNDAYASRLTLLGVDGARVAVQGNIKFDLPEPDPSLLPREVEAWVRRNGGPVWTAGSTHEGEEEIVLNVFRTLREEFPGLKLILSPRRPERFDAVARFLKEAGIPFARRTRLEEAPSEAGVLLLDTLGELPTIYALSDAVFVGGSLVPRGGHNILEPASWGKPVAVGPHTFNFRREVHALLDAGGGERVTSQEELTGRIRQWLSDEHLREETGKAARRMVERNRGAVDRYVRMIEKFFPVI